MYDVVTGWLKNNGHRQWTTQTFAERFGQHDEITGNKIRADRVRLTTTELVASRPPYRKATLPERFQAWVGVRFRTSEDDRDQGK